ncbi:MAG: hypothetical protein CMN29_22820 [Sandaracinus sp.]|nr:hypothetical protein [Sandaracinus sp.]
MGTGRWGLGGGDWAVGTGLARSLGIRGQLAPGLLFDRRARARAGARAGGGRSVSWGRRLLFDRRARAWARARARGEA